MPNRSQIRLILIYNPAISKVLADQTSIMLTKVRVF
jgi:hypothetical protein